ncbi:MAG: RluA family pseudouridine synthase [Clostridia bacterium]
MKIIINNENNGQRIDVALANLLSYSRSRTAKIIAEGLVTVNGLTVDKSSKSVKEGDCVVYAEPEPQELGLLKQDIPIEVIFQDEYLAVINKQQGLTVHPTISNKSNTLVNALLFNFDDLSGINGVMRPGIVHRLDKDTSGLMLVAKCDKAHVDLAKQIQTKQCIRIYQAIVEGVIKDDSGTVDKPIGRSQTDRKKMAIDINGRQAITDYTVLERFDKNTLVKFQLRTGRTHQIRVHTKFLGHPIVGDKTYGFKNQRFSLAGQLLHSCYIEFTHPITKQRLSFASPLPTYFERVLNILRKESRQ